MRSMQVDVQDDPDRSRFEALVDGELAGFVDYRVDGDVYALPHTEVDPRFGGQGIGTSLVLGALAAIAERGGQVLPYCPFIPGIIRDHPEYLDLVPPDRRGQFGL